MTEAWECPRCHIINAPWKASCSCKLDSASTFNSIASHWPKFGSGGLTFCEFCKETYEVSQRPTHRCTVMNCIVCNGMHSPNIPCPKSIIS